MLKMLKPIIYDEINKTMILIKSTKKFLSDRLIHTLMACITPYSQHTESIDNLDATAFAGGTQQQSKTTLF